MYYEPLVTVQSYCCCGGLLSGEVVDVLDFSR